MACDRQNNSCGCGNNGWNNDRDDDNRRDCFIGNRRCRRELEKAVDTLIVIQDLADDFLDDFFNCRNCHCGCRCRCGNERRGDRDDRFERNERRDEDERDDRGRNRCGCDRDCRCDNYWGR